MNVESTMPDKSKRKYREGYILAFVFGIGVVLWPILSFGAIFIFDSPIKNRDDELHRCLVAYFIWYYPLTYFATLLVYSILLKAGIHRWLCCLAWVLPIVVYFTFPTIAGWKNVEQVDSRRIEILYRTNHVALLAACQKIMNPAAGLEYTTINPDDPTLPATITVLKPHSIIVGSDFVTISVFKNAIDRLTVVAYSENYEQEHQDRHLGQLQLIPEMWYSESAFDYQNHSHDRYIEQLKAMKPKDVPAPAWHQSSQTLLP